MYYLFSFNLRQLDMHGLAVQTTSVNAAFAAVEPLAVEPVFNAVQHIRVVQPVPATNQPASGEQVVASTQRENTVVEPTPNVVQGEATPNPTDVPATTNEDQVCTLCQT